MKLRTLRIAWSLAWGIAAVLMIALWMRSYWQNDVLTVKPPEVKYVVNSALGRTDFYFGDRTQRTWDYVAPWTIETSQIDKYFRPPLSDHDANYNRFGVLATRYYFQHGEQAVSASFPTCYPAGVAVAIAAFPWIITVRRFSLRTLLIVTTLVALGMGVIVWPR
jgi:hypothetical protein